MKIELDAERRTVRIAGVNYAFEFFEEMAKLEESDILRVRHDFQSDTRRIQRVSLFKDVA